MDSYELKDVFGVHVPPPRHTYVDRASLDRRIRYLLDVGRHLVIYGPSKQGKTALWQGCLSKGSFVVVLCLKDPAANEIYTDLLGQLGVRSALESEPGRTECRLLGELLHGGQPDAPLYLRLEVF